MSRRIVEEALVYANRDRVFAALTTPAELMQWWTDPALCESVAWELDARPGGVWRSRWRWTNGGAEFELGGEILEIDPPGLLVVSWRDERYGGLPATTVRYELEARGTGTLVRVTHTGFDEVRPDYADYNGGWSSVLNKLLHHVTRPAMSGRGAA